MSITHLTRQATTLACQEHPELYFAESPRALTRAKELCQDCPIISECLAGALERREPYGVWGGELVIDGRVAPMKRGRGRPRKSEVAACA